MGFASLNSVDFEEYNKKNEWIIISSLDENLLGGQHHILIVNFKEMYEIPIHNLF